MDALQIRTPVPRSSPLSTTRVPDLKGVITSFAIAGVCTLLAVGAWRNAEPLFVLFAGIGAVLALFAAVPFGWRLLAGTYGGSALCQTCFRTIEAQSGRQQNVLCSGCGTYYDAKVETMEPIDPARVWHKPLYRVDLSPKDFRDLGATSHASHPSLQSTPLQACDEVKLLTATWPYGCCICGKAPTRFERLLRTGDVRPDYHGGRIGLVALGVPYCALHDNGVAFEKAIFNSRGDFVAGRLLFRAHAFREAFRQSNFCKWSSSNVRSADQ
jgi:hypothetical protein